MLLGGDEFRRTQRGNNNAYCQDNPTSWVDWSRAGQYEALVRFVQRVFEFRRAHPVLRREAFYSDVDVQWFDADGSPPDWLDPAGKRLACWIRGETGGPDLYLMFNAENTAESFVVPDLGRSRQWRLAIDTSQVGDDASANRPVLDGRLYALASHGSAVLEATGAARQILMDH
jgi:glycogen operon protein